MKQAISFYIAKLSYHNYKKEHIFDDDDDDDHALKLINKMETHSISLNDSARIRRFCRFSSLNIFSLTKERRIWLQLAIYTKKCSSAGSGIRRYRKILQSKKKKKKKIASTNRKAEQIQKYHIINTVIERTTLRHNRLKTIYKI
jgi:hypothetical protein